MVFDSRPPSSNERFFVVVPDPRLVRASSCRNRYWSPTQTMPWHLLRSDLPFRAALLRRLICRWLIESSRWEERADRTGNSPRRSMPNFLAEGSKENKGFRRHSGLVS